MTRYDDDILMRRIDGDLSPDQAAAIDTAAAADPALAARLAVAARLRGVVRDAFPIVSDPRDRDLARLVRAGPPSSPGLTARFASVLTEAFAPRRAALWGGLATAAFFGGVLVGPLMSYGDAGAVTVGRNGTIIDSSLVHVLDERLAAEGADAQGRAVGLTFQDADGRWCRTFRAGQAGVAGLACRSGAGWGINVLAPLTKDGDVRTASVDTPEPVLAAVDALIEGGTADGAVEARARDAGWSIKR